MLGISVGNSFTPKFKGAKFYLSSHYPDNSRLVDPIIVFNGFEWRSVLPCHFDNTREFVLRELFFDASQSNLNKKVYSGYETTRKLYQQLRY